MEKRGMFDGVKDPEPSSLEEFVREARAIIEGKDKRIAELEADLAAARDFIALQAARMGGWQAEVERLKAAANPNTVLHTKRKFARDTWEEECRLLRRVLSDLYTRSQVVTEHSPGGSKDPAVQTVLKIYNQQTADAQAGAFPASVVTVNGVLYHWYEREKGWRKATGAAWSTGVTQESAASLDTPAFPATALRRGDGIPK